MEFLVTKASTCKWYKIRTFDSLAELIAYKNACGQDIIITDNDFYNNSIETIISYFNKATKEEAEKISHLEWEIIIYNDYLE